MFLSLIKLEERRPLPTILPEMASADWPKLCACGASWSEEAWRELPLVGLMALSDDEPPLELRHCTCGSTIAVALSAIPREG